ncbi:hypothetical protein Tco_0100514, partial [Tanacetum coccineum]
ESSQPQSSYEAAASLTEFELKNILIDKMDKSKSYLEAPKHRECYDGLIKSYDLNKSLFSTYDKMYSLKRSRKDKDKDEDLSAGSDRGLKKRKTSKDAEPTKGLKAKESWRLHAFLSTFSLRASCNDLRVLRIILVILPEHQSDTKVIHNDDGNPSRANIKQALGR